ncbi:hypothetical protein S7711_00863 [Stachybotrys chartarum IBT 7711]|uniref:Luciferase domain-containing protein n=1 Tax=Stachybotrys chartarum (strain CBS 109288 / IBT 7711) TaxID=1280523 RepID=A0A084B0G0_STACB|nr:hypothetical protein S7711_00863 [Stachybotrys chartarum IBT 7711]KFA50224.1 hypothetical protein S40293_03664 [Stachybotrys chartarum IBT 40293]KFA78205.1 hypothetical protein S40288_01417 [Stachybotrys chartarum IBT 40288]
MSSTSNITTNPQHEAQRHSGLQLDAPDPLPKFIVQNPLSIHLDTRAVFFTTLGLVIAIQFLVVRIVQAAMIAIPAVLYVYNDYQNYLNLGPGGTPSTFKGYLRIAWLHFWALRDPFSAPKPQAGTIPERGILHRRPLPRRAGPRPTVVGIAPQRQIDQCGSRLCFQALRRAARNLAADRPDTFSAGRSFIEKHGLALFARSPLQTRWQGEITHFHDSDYAMHMALHPDDIQQVLDKGWGQRHPLGWHGWRDWLYTMPVSPNFVMIYASRDEKELQVISRIVEAAIWYTLKEEVDLGVYIDFQRELTS